MPQKALTIISMINERYYSHLRNVIIPLPGFKHFHYASSSEDKIEDFIGRSSITDKLSAWLKDSASKYSGAYLVTGYRGMGKSTFVYEAIGKLKKKEGDKKYWKKPKRKATYITVPINVGNELLSAKELLGMICKVGYYNYVKAIKGKNWFISRINTIILAFIIIIAVVVATYFTNDEKIKKYMYYACGILTLVSGYIANTTLYLLWKNLGCKYALTTSHIKRKWRNLLQRIDAEVLLSSEVGGAKEDVLKELAKGINPSIGFRKELKYPIADVPEMQEMMVRLLDLINSNPYTKFRFIFVIDELDKISPKDDEKQMMPEYDILLEGKENETTTKSRQNALSNLMANMKYFISSSKAKFVFIAGYDMYEATLADISNREFNIHSIFNGHINVNSFFRHTEKYSGVDSMIEEYLCHLLIDKEECSKWKSFKDYVRYVESYWTDVIDETRKEYQRILERRIVFLRSFLTYLIYMSNGSPKKLAMYIEKYVRTRSKIEEKTKSPSGSKSNDEYLLGTEDCDFYLYFDNRNVQRICFVDYLIYPMIQNLVDKSNIYNDKLLVSTSFMLSNLYKFHKSGFSMRNLEYMPELLDINKMPELRDFIGGIVNFLTQTHVDETSINLYKYKFPLRLSEEITFYSKTSEEISYLFNFSHDELLSVKKLYMRQLEHYNNKDLNESSPIASLHHMLGDIYMLEEDYELAIYEFQEALSALNRQIEKTDSNDNNSKLLFIIRLTLKLGLAYEKRKTYDTAYLEYENLMKLLLRKACETNCISIGRLSPKDVIDRRFYLFCNIRIMYLAPLAKLYVLEKMDLGGFTLNDINQVTDEAFILIDNSHGKTRAVSYIDFYTKLGDIMYYRNHARDEKCYHADFWYDKALTVCFRCIKKNYGINFDETYCKSICVLFWLLANDKHQAINAIIPTTVRCLINSLIGNANYHLSDPQEKLNERANIKASFLSLSLLADLMENEEATNSGIVEEITLLNTFAKKSNTVQSILYYWDCAILYEAIDEYKSAHCIYVQMLDAIYTLFSVNNIKVDCHVLDFCKYLVVKSILNSYKHYGHINIAEIDKIKSILNNKQIDNINLDYLSNSSDIEIVLYKYYMICFMAEDKNVMYEALRNVVNSRQLGGDKIISSVTQDVQNLYFKEHVNRQILFLLIPKLKEAFEEGKHDFFSTLNDIVVYLHDKNNLDNVIKQLRWNIFESDRKNLKYSTNSCFALLEYLVTDSLFCLNKVTDLLSPLYSTALYNNMFIGECYENGFIWNHILLVLRELLYCPKTDNKIFLNRFSSDLIERYKLNKSAEEISMLLQKGVEHLGNYMDEEDETSDSRIEKLYAKISPSGHRFLTSSYLIGNALDYYHKALDMHNGGKAYKEMMTTLYFLEDDLHNDSCYLNFATEMYCINKGCIAKRIRNLKKLYCGTKSLTEITNYINE